MIHDTRKQAICFVFSSLMTCLAVGVWCVRFELRFALHKEESTEFLFFLPFLLGCSHGSSRAFESDICSFGVSFNDVES